MQRRCHPGGFLHHFDRQLEQIVQRAVKGVVNFILQIVRSNCFVAGISFVVIGNHFGTFNHAAHNHTFDPSADGSQRHQRTAQNQNGDNGQLPGIVNQYADERY